MAMIEIPPAEEGQKTPHLDRGGWVGRYKIKHECLLISFISPCGLR
jgi:hypothetical protein